MLKSVIPPKLVIEKKKTIEICVVNVKPQGTIPKTLLNKRNRKI